MGASTPYEPLDYSEQLARIERAQAETRKFVAEQNKLAAEQGKLNEEGLKLIQEARKLKSDRMLAPLVLLASLIGGAIVAFINHYVH